MLQLDTNKKSLTSVDLYNAVIVVYIYIYIYTPSLLRVVRGRSLASGFV